MPGEGRVSKRKINSSWVLFIAFFILISDQITKFVIQNLIPLNTPISIINNILYLTLTFNRGAAFGILKNQNLFFITLGITAAFFMILYLGRLEKKSFFVKIGFALILGGILGNLIDRLRFGYVIDFLDLSFWPVFNIADSAITIGAGLIIIHLLKRRA